jgi:hypothetical protein
MKPTRMHYFYAQNWPAWIWFTVAPLLCVLIMANALGTPPHLYALGVEAKSYLFLLGLAWLLGYLVAGLLGWFIFGPVYHYRAELNGAPFQPGDRVQILVGRDRGRVVRVAEVWDWRGDLRVDLGDLAGRKRRTIFGFAQVIRATDAEPPVAADTPQAARR